MRYVIVILSKCCLKVGQRKRRRKANGERRKFKKTKIVTGRNHRSKRVAKVNAYF